MTQQEVDNINQGLSKEAQIYWIPGTGAWTSKLWHRLYSDGWSMTNNKGLVTVKHPDGTEAYAAIGKTTVLALLEDYLRNHKE